MYSRVYTNFLFRLVFSTDSDSRYMKTLGIDATILAGNGRARRERLKAYSLARMCVVHRRSRSHGPTDGRYAIGIDAMYCR